MTRTMRVTARSRSDRARCDLQWDPNDGIKRACVHTAIGSEEDYLLHVAELEALGVATPSFSVHVFDLGHEDIVSLVERIQP